MYAALKDVQPYTREHIKRIKAAAISQWENEFNRLSDMGQQGYEIGEEDTMRLCNMDRIWWECDARLGGLIDKTVEYVGNEGATVGGINLYL